MPRATQSGGSATGKLIVNVIGFSLAWSLAWAIGDIVGYVVSNNSADFNVTILVKNAIAGAIAGAIGGLGLSIAFWGISILGLGRMAFLVLFWSVTTILVTLNLEDLGIYAINDFVNFSGGLAVLFGLIYALGLLPRKRKWFFLSVPLGTVAVGFAAIMARAIQFEMLTF